ncbi:PREDICTED: coiled-coil domain-containing protein 102B isoform X2 [Chinchilla lanigera]|uniref:coiled-coil domain-containing protein 102B isoform X2 n=1 Tax=Chinchilla lanigera TaxID=34839 RepID=UPI00038F06B3|nr:PREDICTED: coiled-coil domain-containing protein 102B isoform X2 [Chinchilla lanigera]
MQQSSIKPRSDKVVPTSFPKDPIHSDFPRYGLQSTARHSYGAHSFSTNSWDIHEERQLWELEEVKARAAQMEKTMRWWSDCTANWREKWSKVRAERNSAREEGRQLRIKLEMTVKELNELKKKQSLSLQRKASQANVTQDLEFPTIINMAYDNRAPFQTTSQMHEFTGECLMERQFPTEKANDKIIGSGNGAVVPGLRLQVINLPLEEEGTKISALQIHLNEFQQSLWKEREMRTALEKELEQMASALSLWKRKYDDLRGSKASDGKELERLQAENTSGWNNTKLLATEKQGLERENRRLKVQLKEMEELLDRKNRLSANFKDPDLKTSQIELQEKNKVWCSWKRLFSYCVFSSEA